MIRFLPREITPAQIASFSFGDVEASNDGLLQFDSCICKTKSINDFLKDNKNIAVGDRGSGKSALFRMLKDRMIKFDLKDSNSYTIIALDDEIEYVTIKSKIMPCFEVYGDQEVLKYQAMWEFYFLFKIISQLKKDSHADDEIKKLFNKFGKVVRLDASYGLFDVFKNLQFQIGCKLTQSQSSDFMLPDFYIKPVVESGKQEPDSALMINLEESKELINSYLRKSKVSVYVLLDKLDEFVVGERYEVQQLLLEGLVSTVFHYTRFSNIVLKVFMRNDLFNNINYAKTGYAKINTHIVELCWCDSDIYEFISQRIAWNLIQALGMPSIQITLDKKNYFYARLQREFGIYKRILGLLSGFYRWLIDEKSAISELDKSTKRDEINKMFITCLFPSRITHRDVDGNEDDIDICTYFNTHFKVSSGSINPRLIVMFLNYCIEISFARHADNGQNPILLNANNEYELFSKYDIVKAYAKVQELSWEDVLHASREWKQYVSIFKECRYQSVMSYDYLKKNMDIEEGVLRNFLAFLAHAGVLINKFSPGMPHKRRKYELPIVFKNIFI